MSDTTKSAILASAKDIDLRVKRSDLDRWLAARCAPPADRRTLNTLYALNLEWVRALGASEPTLSLIRLQWWREALEEIFAGEPPRRHDLTLAAAEAFAARPACRTALLEIIQNYEDAVEGGGDDARCAAAGALAGLASDLLGGPAGDMRAAIVEAGAVYQSARLMGPGAAPRISRRARFRPPPETLPATAYFVFASDYAAGKPAGGLRKRIQIIMTILKCRV